MRNFNQFQKNLCSVRLFNFDLTQIQCEHENAVQSMNLFDVQFNINVKRTRFSSQLSAVVNILKKQCWTIVSVHQHHYRRWPIQHRKRRFNLLIFLCQNGFTVNYVNGENWTGFDSSSAMVIRVDTSFVVIVLFKRCKITTIIVNRNRISRSINRFLFEFLCLLCSKPIQIYPINGSVSSSTIVRELSLKSM